MPCDLRWMLTQCLVLNFFPHCSQLNGRSEMKIYSDDLIPTYKLTLRMLKEYMKLHVSFPIELPAMSWSKQPSWSTVVIKSILNKVPLTLDSGDSRSLSQTFSWSSHSLSGWSCGWSTLPHPQNCDHNGRTGGSVGINKEPSVKDLLPGWGGRSARAPQAPLVFQFENHSWEFGIRIL